MAFNVDAIKNEILRYVATKPQVLQAALLSDAIFLRKYTKTVRKVKGEFPSIQALVSHVVQTFYSKKFTPYGDISFYKKDLRAFRQKVDFQFDPADVLGTVLESEYNETQKREQMSISKMAIDWLKAKIIDDVNLLSVIGVYDVASIGADVPVFGKSMNGLNKILLDLQTNTVNPAYSIPGDAITAANTIAAFNNFEKGLPEGVKPKIKTIFTSITDAENYQMDVLDTYGQNKFVGDTVKTIIGRREIVGIPNLTPGTIFATDQSNFLELIDDRENPAEISDIQVDKRIINVLGEFSLGYDFALNQGVYLHTTDAEKDLGLNDTTQNKLFYPSQFG